MAFKLNKEEIEQRDKIIAELGIKSSELDKAITATNEAANKAIETLLLPINAKIAAYNLILAEARKFTENVAARMQDEFDERAEKWQEGAKGIAANEIISTWNNMELDDVEEVSIEPIEQFDLWHREDLESAEKEV
jgi:hypothetical protein